MKGEGKSRGGDAGIVLDERWCGKGYAVESLEASLSWCFAEEGEDGDEVRASSLCSFFVLFFSSMSILTCYLFFWVI